MTKTALISGADTPVGRATVEAFLDADWAVWAGAPDEGDLADLAECETVELDVTNARECERAVETVVDETGTVDCLVTTGRRGPFGAVEDVSTAALDEAVDATLLGPHRLLRAALPHMRDQESGTVIHVTGVAGRVSGPGFGARAASQGALASLSDALRAELDPFGVDVVVVEPGPIDSALDTDSPTADEPTGAYEWLARARENTRLTGIGDALSVTPWAVALTVRDAACASDPAPRYAVGEGARLLLLARHLPGRWRDRALGVVRRLVERD